VGHPPARRVAAAGEQHIRADVWNVLSLGLTPDRGVVELAGGDATVTPFGDDGSMETMTVGRPVIGRRGPLLVLVGCSVVLSTVFCVAFFVM
jgi:hypothetical protein